MSVYRSRWHAKIARMFAHIFVCVTNSSYIATGRVKWKTWGLDYVNDCRCRQEVTSRLSSYIPKTSHIWLRAMCATGHDCC